MGQNVEINDTVVLGDVLLIATDRSFTGQDGHVMTPGSDGHAVPGWLARRLFDLDLGIDHVYVLQNTVTLRRPGGWDDEMARAVTEVTSHFLRHYPDSAGADEEE